MTEQTHAPGQRVKTCKCASCRFTHSVERVQRKLNRYDRAVIEKLLNRWAHQSMEAVYYRKKLEGKWPA